MITLDELKQYMQISDSSQDAFLQTCADNAISTVNDFCGRDFRAASYTEYISGKSTPIIKINNFPLSSVSLLQFYDSSIYDYSNIITGAGDTIGNSARLLSATGEIILLKGYLFPPGESNIKITYTGGYSSAPADIKGVCLEIAAVYYKNSYAGKGGGRLGLLSQSAGSGESITFDTNLTKKWQMILNAYRNINV